MWERFSRNHFVYYYARRKRFGFGKSFCIAKIRSAPKMCRYILRYKWNLLIHGWLTQWERVHLNEVKSVETCRKWLTLMYVCVLQAVLRISLFFLLFFAGINGIKPFLAHKITEKSFYMWPAHKNVIVTLLESICEMCQIVGNWTYRIRIIRLHK